MPRIMEYIKPLFHIILGLELLEECSGFPVDLLSSGESPLAIYSPFHPIPIIPHEDTSPLPDIW